MAVYITVQFGHGDMNICAFTIYIAKHHEKNFQIHAVTICHLVNYDENFLILNRQFQAHMYISGL